MYTNGAKVHLTSTYAWVSNNIVEFTRIHDQNLTLVSARNKPLDIYTQTHKNISFGIKNWWLNEHTQ